MVYKSLTFGLMIICAAVSAVAQATSTTGSGVYRPDPIAPAPEPQQSAPIAQPTSATGVDIVDKPNDEAAATGRVVRVGKPETMDLLDNTRIIKLGDRLEYMVAEDREPPSVIFVAEDGSIDEPLVGKIPAAGKTYRELAKEISSKLEEDYYYQATVHIAEHRNARTRGEVFVMGQVNNQGMVTIPQSEVLTLSRAILQAGGFAAYADPTRVTITRRDRNNPEAERKLEVNVNEILVDGQLDKDVVLQSNDLIFVPPRGDNSGTFTISGAVRAPGSFPLASGQQLYLSQAILQAGGFTEFGKGSDVKLVRHNESGERSEQTVDVDKILKQGIREGDVLIQPGDMIIVGERWFQF